MRQDVRDDDEGGSTMIAVHRQRHVPGNERAAAFGVWGAVMAGAAAIGPLLGLFGTVIGMIEIFGSQTPQAGNPLVLAHGSSIALYNTAFGLVVAVPSMIFYRYYRAKVDAMLVDMELQAIKLVEIFHGERQA